LMETHTLLIVFNMILKLINSRDSFFEITQTKKSCSHETFTSLKFEHSDVSVFSPLIELSLATLKIVSKTTMIVEDIFFKFN
jgi:hypothetical protein